MAPSYLLRVPLQLKWSWTIYEESKTCLKMNREFWLRITYRNDQLCFLYVFSELLFPKNSTKGKFSFWSIWKWNPKYVAYIIYYTWGVSLSLSIRAGHAPYFLLCLSLRQCFPFPASRMARQRGRFRHHFFAHRFKKRTIIVESSIKLRKIHSKVRIDGLGKNPLKFWLYISTAAY